MHTIIDALIEVGQKNGWSMHYTSIPKYGYALLYWINNSDIELGIRIKIYDHAIHISRILNNNVVGSWVYDINDQEFVLKLEEITKIYGPNYPD